MPQARWLYSLYTLITMLFVAIPASGQASSNTIVVAISGDLSPDGNGALSIPEVPVIHNGGSAVFTSDLRTDEFLVGSGIFSGNGTPGSLVLIVREDAPTPNIDGNFGPFNNPPLRVNGSNQVAFISSVTNALDPLSAMGCFIADGTLGGVTEIARANQLTPSGDGRLAFPFSDPAFNDVGQVAFASFLTETSATSGRYGIFRAVDSPGGLTEIVRLGQIAPDGVGNFTSIGPPQGVPLNESGHVLFNGRVSGQDSIYTGLFRGDGNSVAEVVREGSVTPSGNGTFGRFDLTAPAFNNAGEAAFVASLNDTALAAADNVGLFRGDGVTMTEIVRKGDTVPGGDGRFLEIAPNVALNDAGQVLFAAALSGASGGTDAGIFIGDGGELISIARFGGAAPGGEGTFSDFIPVTLALNAAGQAVFMALIDLPSGIGATDATGLFFYDRANGLLPVARTGDTLADKGEISALLLNGGTWFMGDEGSGLNDQGQVAYRFTAAGNIGIAIWSAVSATPPPAQ